MFSHIIVPLDGSPSAEGALPTARELAHKFDSTITLLHVLVNIPHASILPSESHDELLDSIRRTAYEEAVSYLGKIGDSLRQDGLDNVFQHIIESPSPADAILSCSASLDADAIVMSTHGRSGINRWVFGSVAERVVRATSIPVVLIRTYMAEQEARENGDSTEDA